jgi:hypothetical protein
MADKKLISPKQVQSVMAQKSWSYVPGPRMGTNNYMYGIELKDLKKTSNKKKAK